MICTNCPNSLYKLTGVMSCYLPHCNKDIDLLAERLVQLIGKTRNESEEVEYRMIKQEMERHINAK